MAGAAARCNADRPRHRIPTKPGRAPQETRGPSPPRSRLGRGRRARRGRGRALRHRARPARTPPGPTSATAAAGGPRTGAAPTAASPARGWRPTSCGSRRDARARDATVSQRRVGRGLPVPWDERTRVLRATRCEPIDFGDDGGADGCHRKSPFTPRTRLRRPLAALAPACVSRRRASPTLRTPGSTRGGTRLARPPGLFQQPPAAARLCEPGAIALRDHRSHRGAGGGAAPPRSCGRATASPDAASAMGEAALLPSSSPLARGIVLLPRPQRAACRTAAAVLARAPPRLRGVA